MWCSFHKIELSQQNMHAFSDICKAEVTTFHKHAKKTKQFKTRTEANY